MFGNYDRISFFIPPQCFRIQYLPSCDLQLVDYLTYTSVDVEYNHTGFDFMLSFTLTSFQMSSDQIEFTHLAFTLTTAQNNNKATTREGDKRGTECFNVLNCFLGCHFQFR